jgi:RNA-directed DNA polymerase
VTPLLSGETEADVGLCAVPTWSPQPRQFPVGSRRLQATEDVIPKPDGKQRPLGIGTIRDRVAQMAATLVLEPIFEADLPPEQHTYRAEVARDRSEGAGELWTSGVSACHRLSL